MRLGRIEHIRCNENDGFTYVVIPDGWTEEQFEEAVYKASKEYEDVVRNYKPTTPEEFNLFMWGNTFTGQPPYNKFPNKTVKEVQELYKNKKEKYAAWKKEQDKALVPFSEYLCRAGIESVIDQQPEFEASVDWGHAHSIPLDYNDELGIDIQGPKVDTEEYWSYYTPSVKRVQLNNDNT